MLSFNLLSNLKCCEKNRHRLVVDICGHNTVVKQRHVSPFTAAREHTGRDSMTGVLVPKGDTKEAIVDHLHPRSAIVTATTVPCPRRSTVEGPTRRIRSVFNIYITAITLHMPFATSGKVLGYI